METDFGKEKHSEQPMLVMRIFEIKKHKMLNVGNFNEGIEQQHIDEHGSKKQTRGLMGKARVRNRPNETEWFAPGTH